MYSKLSFFSEIKFFDPSRKYFSITSISSVIHQILLKIKWNRWGFVDHWRSVQQTNVQLYWRHCRYILKSCTKLCWLGD